MNRICQLFGIQYPIIQGGMVWCSGWRLASAVSNAGGLGLIGAGSMHPEVLREHIRKCQVATDKPFGVNIMLMSPHADEVAKVIVEEAVPVVTTGAGSPEKYMKMWKAAGVKVIPVVASVALAKRMERCGADAVVAEGTEAGGHIGENTTIVRAKVLEYLGYLGITVDAQANEVHGEEKVISTADSKVKVCVIPTNEELAIARETVALVK